MAIGTPVVNAKRKGHSYDQPDKNPFSAKATAEKIVALLQGQ